jgi:hypothetical protein
VGLRKRLENLEATVSVGHRRTTPELEVYFRALENHCREEAGLPPLPPTPEELTLERETGSAGGRFCRHDRFYDWRHGWCSRRAGHRRHPRVPRWYPAR